MRSKGSALIIVGCPTLENALFNLTLHAQGTVKMPFPYSWVWGGGGGDVGRKGGGVVFMVRGIQ